MEYLPALSVLVAATLLTALILRKLSGDQLKELFLEGKPLIPIVAALFVTVVILHLFVAQPWTADVLKVVVGLLGGAAVGATAVKATSAVDIAESLVENSTIVGRDYFDQKIEQMATEVANIESAVIAQRATSEELATALRQLDGLELVSQPWHYQSRLYPYNFGGDVETIQEDIAEDLEAGWQLGGISLLPDYEGEQRLWVLLGRPRPAEGFKGAILVDRKF